MLSLTISMYLGSKIFKGTVVLGKIIKLLKGNIGIWWGNLSFISLLNKELRKSKARGADKVEGPLKVRKDMRTGAQKPGASAIEIDARINRKYR